jgi:dTDP-4-dehydrorhamnose reductase
MRILLLGKNGQLGWELQRTLAPLGDLISFDFPQFDLLDEGATRHIIQDERPQLIVNATAYTAVDQAEKEPELAQAINAVAPGYIAEQARLLGAGFVHFSTDYVFDGYKGSPYLESDEPNPLGVYGKSKLEGERNIEQVGGPYLILRTSWLYSLRRDSFVTRVLQWSRQQEVIRVVDDQISNPTWARMLAEVVAQLLAKGGENMAGWLGDRSGVYHLAGNGFTSRYAWACEILACDPERDERITKQVIPASSKDFPTLAKRPPFSALNCTRFFDIFGLQLPDWKTSLHMAMEVDSI